MNRDALIENFWDLIEQQLSISFPKYLRNILKLRGFDSAGSIKYITDEDIAKFEHFAKATMVNVLPKNYNREEYFSIYSGPEDFEIIPGHKILIQEVVQYVKEMIGKHGKNYFNFSESGGTTHQPFMNKRASQFSTKTKNQIELRKAIVSGEDNETKNQKEHERESYIKQEQLNLIKKVKVWLEKNVDTMSTKYSKEIHERTVYMSVETVGKIQKLCANIKCFVCDELIKMSEIRKVLADLSFETYLSASNLYTHIKLHQKKGELNIRRNIIEASDEDEDASCKNTSKQQLKNSSVSAPKRTIAVNRFLEHSRGNAKYSNQPKVKHLPHTVTSQVNDKKSKRAFLWTVEEDVEEDKTDNKVSDCFLSQESKKKKIAVDLEFEEPGSHIKIKTKRQNVNTSESAVSQSHLDSLQNRGEISPVVDLVEDTDSDYSVKELSCTNKSKELSRFNLHTKSGKNNDFHQARTSTDPTEPTAGDSSAAITNKMHFVLANYQGLKTSEVPTIQFHGNKNVNIYSEDASNSEISAMKTAKAINSEAINKFKDKKASKKARKKANKNKNKGNFGSKGDKSSRKIVQIHSSDKTEKKKVDKEGDKFDLAINSVLLDKKGNEFQTSNDERKAKAQTKRSMNIQNDKELEKKLPEDIDFNDRLDSIMTKKFEKNRDIGKKNKGKMLQTFHGRNED